MSVRTEPLDELAKRIAESEAQLEALRREHESRSARLAELQHRKEELQAQIQGLEAEIAAIASGTRFPEATAPAEAWNRAPGAVLPQGPATGHQPTLADLIISILRDAGGPMTAQEVVDEAVQRGFTTASRDIPGLFKTRIGELVRKGVLRRVEGKVEWAAPESTNGAPQTAGRPAAGQPPLRVVLTGILQKNRRPVALGDLAQRALAAGYATKSRDFPNVVAVTLAGMGNVEKVPGEGYRLKNAQD